MTNRQLLENELIKHGYTDFDMKYREVVNDNYILCQYESLPFVYKLGIWPTGKIICSIEMTRLNGTVHIVNEWNI